MIGSFIIFKYKSQTTLAPDKSSESKNSILDSSRVTKKTFGTYVSPKDSPIQPEKFTGYHTGVDFETTASEAGVEVLVPVLFDGKLVFKKFTTGYGGVVVIESAIEGQLVTTIYGHLKLDSVTTLVGQFVKKNDTLGILGKGYSSETDGERKHLHLSIHLGKDINLLGYVKTKAELAGWLHPVVFVK